MNLERVSRVLVLADMHGEQRCSCLQDHILHCLPECIAVLISRGTACSESEKHKDSAKESLHGVVTADNTPYGTLLQFKDN